MKKKVFITGVAGFLGSHLADRFLKLGYHVVGCDNLIGGYTDNVSSDVEFYNYDCRYLNSMKKIIDGADAVYHCAATAYEGLSVFSPSFIAQNTFQISTSVISAAISSNIKRFIYCSSMARYGSIGSKPFSENMECRPQDPYGICKYAGELFLANLAKVHGMEHVIVVPHNIIGPRQKYDDPYRNVASIMINLMLQGRQPIIYGDGNQKRCFSYVEDDLQVLEKLIDADNVVGETINIGPDEEVITINELAIRIASILNFSLDPIYVPARPQEVNIAYCSAEKARKLLSYQTKYTLDRALEEMITWIQKRGTRPFKYLFDIEIQNEKTPVTWSKKMF